MTEKELKRLSRVELLALLLDEVQKNEEITAKVSDLESRLASKELKIEKAGSIAEAALQLNGIFEAAEASVQQYMENIQKLSGKQEIICQKMKEEAQTEAETMVSEAKIEADIMVAEAERKTATMLSEAKKEAESMITKANEEARFSLSKAQKEAENSVSEAKIEAETMLAKAETEAQTMVAEARKEADDYWKQVSEKIEAMLKQEQSLRGLLSIYKERHEQ